MKTVLVAIVVASLNVGLNCAARRVSAIDASARQRFLSIEFGVAFAIGTVSLLCLIEVYRSNINLSQAILMMGAASIVGGSLFGMVAHGNRLNLIETVLLIVIASLFVLRFYVANKS